MSWKDVQDLVEGSDAYRLAAEQVEAAGDLVHDAANWLIGIGEAMQERHMRSNLGGEEALQAYYARMRTKAQEDARRVLRELREALLRDQFDD